MENKTVFELAMRLNEIMKIQNSTGTSTPELDEEFNAIVYELWDRIPSLQDSVDIQPKVKKKER